jgi:TPR repeat protein
VSYDKGNGAEDLKKALSFYKKAAALGHAQAHCNLGVNYLEGLGTRRSLAKGIEWTRKAARNGDDIAQYNLGMAYLDGEGVRPNKRNARLWLKKAAKQGYKKAVSVLRRAS